MAEQDPQGKNMTWDPLGPTCGNPLPASRKGKRSVPGGVREFFPAAPCAGKGMAFTL